jgi:hypothetical protein
MPKYKIQATRTQWYEIEVEASDEEAAYHELDDWVSDDFEDFQVNAQWEFDVAQVDGDDSDDYYKDEQEEK